MNQLRLNRMTVQKDIRSLIGTNTANTKLMFEPDRTANTVAKLRIPDHQRFYVWPEAKQAILIDSIMNNSPLPLMVFTEQIVQNGSGSGSAWFVQDGQQRLITLQRFVQGEFVWNHQKFSDLNEDDRMNFLGYTITCEIVHNPNPDQIACIFERLNCGKPLTDNDKFWNRRESMAVSFTLNKLMHCSELADYFKKYVGKIGSGKSRSQLADIVSAVVAISRQSVDCIATSYDKAGQYVCEPISEEMQEYIIRVFQEYFAIIDLALRTHSVAKPSKLYIKLTGMLGIYLFWRLHPEYSAQEDQASLIISNRCWCWFSWKLQEKDFKKDYFVSLASGHQRNVDKEALKYRTEFLMSDFRARIAKASTPALLDNIVFEISEDSDESGTNSSDEEN